MNTEEIIRNFCRGIRNYRAYDAEYGIVKKIWNNGMGCLALFRIYKDERIILVNNALVNRADKRKLMRLTLDMKDAWDIDTCEWDIREVYFGYPLFYNNCFTLELLEDEKMLKGE